MFHFANDIKYKSFYYDQNQRHKIKQRICSKSHYRAESYQISNVTNIELGLQNLSKEFNDCYQYNAAIKEDNWGELRQNYIQCKIIKSITCGENIKEQHFKKKSVNSFCKFRFDETSSKFSISITNSHYKSTQIGGELVDFLLGYLRCSIKDPMLGSKFYFDEPFKLTNNVTSFQMESAESNIVVILIVFFVFTFVAVLLLYHTKTLRRGNNKSQS